MNYLARSNSNMPGKRTAAAGSDYVLIAGQPHQDANSQVERMMHFTGVAAWGVQPRAKLALIPIFYRTPKPASGENDHQIYNSNYYNYSITTLLINLPHCNFEAYYASRKIL